MLWARLSHNLPFSFQHNLANNKTWGMLPQAGDRTSHMDTICREEQGYETAFAKIEDKTGEDCPIGNCSGSLAGRNLSGEGFPGMMIL